MKLVDVYAFENATQALYELLKQRSSSHAISHRAVPAFAEHQAFVQSRPYRYWYLVRLGTRSIGSAYITENNEIGIFVIDEHADLQPELLKVIVAGHEPLPAVKSKRVAAFSINANPANASLVAAITCAGGVHVQNTYLLSAPPD